MPNSTQNLKPTLKDQTISGMVWSLLQNVGGKGISFVVSIILARLLTPEVFGLVGMLMIFIQLSRVLVQAGFNQALIQKKDTDEEDFSTVFWINFVVSLLIYGILFLGAPWIAEFYEQDILTPLTRAFGLVFVLNAFSYVQEAKLQKEMRFKTLTIIHLPSTILGGIVSVVMALMGYGVWSLIALQIVTSLVYSVQIWIYARWKPLWAFNKAKAKGLFSFGGSLMFSAILDTVFQNIYIVAIAKYFPLSAAGYYQNAKKLVNTPSITFSNALNKVAFPAFSSIQDDDQRLKQGFKKVIQQVLFWLCPLFILAGVMATPLFGFVLGKQWLPAVPYFQWLCVVGIFLPLNLYNLNIVNVKGRSDIILKLEVVKKIIVVIGVIIAVPIGVYALLIFQAGFSVFAYFLNGHFSGKFINYPLKEQVKDIIPIFLLGISTGIIVWLLNRQMIHFPELLRLIIGFVVGGGCYWLLAQIFKLAPLFEFKQIFETNVLNKIKK